MTCLESRSLLDAYFDDELDLSRSFEVDEHLSTCSGCSAELRNREQLRAEIAASDFDLGTDAALERMRRSVRKQAHFQPSRTLWKGAAAALATAALILIAIELPPAHLPPGHLGTSSADVDREVVDNHLRSLVGAHLIDVPSSDRHTVKPWFQGKLDFAPNVPDLSGEGFVLEGGRLEVVGGRKAAAIVYKRREHVINLLISHADGGASTPELRDVDGYHVVSWSRGGLTYRAVSDLDPGELHAFADAIRAH